MTSPLAGFDPNSASTADSGIFGLPFVEEDARLIVIPVPWEVTTSYGGGTSGAPAAVLAASRQVDLFDLELVRPYAPGIFIREPRSEIATWNDEGKALAQHVINVAGRVEGAPELEHAVERVNELGSMLNDLVSEEAASVLAAGKIPALIGGDHSVPFGAIRAMGRHEKSFGILHVDAHSDTRDAYEGFVWSHASIMRNVLDHVPSVTRLVQVGIRDFCEQEWEYCRSQGDRVRVFYDDEIARAKLGGEHWHSICKRIVDSLPDRVWISFDIDGLDPSLCPHTGTPVPGGLFFQETCFLLRTLALSGREVIGFDVNEVAPGPPGDEWDANVGARLTYKLACWTFASLGLVATR